MLIKHLIIIRFLLNSRNNKRGRDSRPYPSFSSGFYTKRIDFEVELFVPQV